MPEILVRCDRCGREFVGLEDDNFTSGYYNVGPGGGYALYGRRGERKLCDHCMHTDKRWQRLYWKHKRCRECSR